MPLISIVIPYYNRAGFLTKTLQSIVASDYRPLELLLVNNASTDDSENVARNFFQGRPADNIIVRHLSEQRPGAAAARNCGLREATGEMVYFFDSDDELSPDFFSWAVSVMKKTKADIVGAPTRMVWPDGREKVRAYTRRPTLAAQILTGQLATQSLFYRTAWLRRQGGWNAALHFWDDWELGIRVLLSRPNLVWDAGRVFHRLLQHDDSLTGPSLSASYAPLQTTLNSVESLLRSEASLSSHDRQRALRALACREAIVAGTLHAEGHDEGARSCLQRAYSVLPEKSYRWFLRLIYTYTRHGGRAAWRIARWLC